MSGSSNSGASRFHADYTGRRKLRFQREGDVPRLSFFSHFWQERGKRHSFLQKRLDTDAPFARKASMTRHSSEKKMTVKLRTVVKTLLPGLLVAAVLVV